MDDQDAKASKCYRCDLPFRPNERKEQEYSAFFHDIGICVGRLVEEVARLKAKYSDPSS